MNNTSVTRLIPALLAFCILHFPFCIAAHAASTDAQSVWVSQLPSGTLAYKTTPAGDRIMDFSHAGYRGGGVSLPDLPVKITIPALADSKADATARIQAALDKVSALPPDANGHRGAVLLAPGIYTCSDALTITASGVVLRGSGDATIIRMTGPRHTAIQLGRRTMPAEASASHIALPETHIADRYVPSGANTFAVADARGLRVGDTIEIRKHITAGWITFMQMHDLVRDGKPQTWLKPGTLIATTRRIAAINKNTLTLDVPLSDSFDAKYANPPGHTVAKITPPVTVSESGVENLRIQSPAQAVGHGQALYSAIRLNGEDCWLRNIRIEETMNSVSVNGRRHTLQNIDVIRKARHEGASKPAEFAANASQVLITRCTVEADNVWYAATNGRHTGPIVFLDCKFTGNGSRVEGHERWTTGVLFDNCEVEGGIDLKNRGSMGSGHGWAIAWSVLWNCKTRDYVVQQPPGTCNWAIGCIGEPRQAPRPFDKSPMLAEGIYDSPGKPVTPRSLYQAQLAARLGPGALRVLEK